MTNVTLSSYVVALAHVCGPCPAQAFPAQNQIGYNVNVSVE